MTNKDQEVWEAYKRSVRGAPKKKNNLVTVKSLPKTTALRQTIPVEPTKLSFANSSSDISETISNPLERKREKAFRQGHVVIDAKLDLHGMTQTEAFEALAGFMRKAAKGRKRHVLIVTGKGRGGTGVLRNNLRKWLSQLDEAKTILALRSAAPQHGGEGAFYVILRKT